MDMFGQSTLGVYCTVFMLLGFEVTFFIKHGESVAINSLLCIIKECYKNFNYEGED